MTCDSGAPCALCKSEAGRNACQRISLSVGVRVAVYEGHRTECLFLQSLLGGSDIQAQVVNAGLAEENGLCRVCVDQAVLDDAMPLVNDFSRNGRKSEWPLR